MKTKKTAKHSSSLGGKVRSPLKRKVVRRKAELASGSKAKTRKGISFQTRSDEIHDSLDDAIKRLESGDLSPQSATGILEKLSIVQTLVRAATLELEDC